MVQIRQQSVQKANLFAAISPFNRLVHYNVHFVTNSHCETINFSLTMNFLFIKLMQRLHMQAWKSSP